MYALVHLLEKYQQFTFLLQLARLYTSLSLLLSFYQAHVRTASKFLL